MSAASLAILMVVVALTLLGDYLIKVSSLRTGGLASPAFLMGAALYGLPAVGWFFLMRSHSLAAVGVLYSASTIVLMAALGLLAFGEPLSGRKVAALGLALLAVVVAQD